MECYSPVTKTGIMKFTSKWIELGKIILIEETQYAFRYVQILAVNSVITKLQSVETKRSGKE